MSNFVIIGAAGYIAPKHMAAIKACGHQLLAGYDPNDSVGIIDSYFPDADFFVEFERFDRYIDKLRREGRQIDYMSICSPNYLHDAHIRFALKHGAHAICEKPMVLDPANIAPLEDISRETGKDIYNILQLRIHPVMTALKERIMASPKRISDIDLSYITARGRWYQISWKGDPSRSGGVATNIGIHFFDTLIWIFGEVKKNTVYHRDGKTCSGFLELERARVRWFMSIDENTLPTHVRHKGATTFRSLTVDNEDIDFSEGFTELHTECYRQILTGTSFSASDSRAAITLAYDIRHASICTDHARAHPILSSRA